MEAKGIVNPLTELYNSFDHITDRCHFEKKKILHIWNTVDFLRDICLSAIPGHPNIHMVKFLALLLCKKAILFTISNIENITQRTNIFELKNFNEWCNIPAAETLLMQQQSYVKDWGKRLFIWQKRCEPDFSKIHIGEDGTNRYLAYNDQVPLSELTRAIDFCFKFLFEMREDKNISNPEIRCLLYRTIIYSDFARRIPNVWPYESNNDFINTWTKINKDSLPNLEDYVFKSIQI